MNLFDALETTASTTRKHGDWLREPDTSWEPILLSTQQLQLLSTESSTEDSSPSLVLEVGLSEAAGKLVLDTRGWIEAANSQTRIVITVQVMEEAPKITIQIWGRTASTSTPPTITRQYRACAIKQQEIQISYNKRNETISVFREHHTCF